MSFYNPDAHTPRVVPFITSATDPRIVSAWARVEFSSALGIQVRRGDLTSPLAVEILEAFGAHCVGGFYRPVGVEGAHFAEAERLLSQLTRPLRSADALHLAAAKQGGWTLVTVDATLANVAEDEGVETVRLLAG